MYPGMHTNTPHPTKRKPEKSEKETKIRENDQIKKSKYKCKISNWFKLACFWGVNTNLSAPLPSKNLEFADDYRFSYWIHTTKYHKQQRRLYKKEI